MKVLTSTVGQVIMVGLAATVFIAVGKMLTAGKDIPFVSDYFALI